MLCNATQQCVVERGGGGGRPQVEQRRRRTRQETPATNCAATVAICSWCVTRDALTADALMPSAVRPIEETSSPGMRYDKSPTMQQCRHALDLRAVVATT